MKIAIGGDHAGYFYKKEIIQYLANKNIEVKDFGPSSEASVDYPDFAHPLSESVAKNECALGILICGSGNGVAMSANKHQEIRAALCWNVDIAQLARQHNNANVICIPARFVSEELAFQMVDAFIETDFEGGRHQRRVDKISC